MNRFYLDPAAGSAGPLSLSPEDAHHARDVLRLKAGDAIECVQNGIRFSAVLSQVTRDGVLLEKGAPLPSTEAALSITLFQGLPKGDKMEWIIQKSVELGVTRIVPVQMARSVVRLKAQEGERKAERWRKIAREAGKQSGRCLIPEVTAPVAPDQLSSLFSGLQAVAVPWEDCRVKGPKAFSADHPGLRSLGIVIGPEGGISPEEIAFLRQAGCVPITLGPRILRTETAGLAAVSAFLCLYGEME